MENLRPERGTLEKLSLPIGIFVRRYYFLGILAVFIATYFAMQIMLHSFDSSSREGGELAVLKAKARTGDIDSMFDLYVALQKANLPAESYIWLEKSAAAGHIEASLHYFDLAFDYDGKADMAKALIYIRTSAEKGNGEACHRLARELQCNPVRGQPHEADRWYKCAIEKRVPEAYVDYAEYLLSRGNNSQAISVAKAGLGLVVKESVTAKELRKLIIQAGSGQ